MTSLKHRVVAMDGFLVSRNYCAGWTRTPAILWLGLHHNMAKSEAQLKDSVREAYSSCKSWTGDCRKGNIRRRSWFAYVDNMKVCIFLRKRSI